MDGWSTRLGGLAMESINSIATDIDKIGRNYPTLRDHFAMSALNGLLACNDVRGNSETLSRIAYQYADAMLAERNKEG